jgi:hypothetical protein
MNYFLWKLSSEHFLDLYYISEFPNAFVSQFEVFLIFCICKSTVEEADLEDINKKYY